MPEQDDHSLLIELAALIDPQKLKDEHRDVGGRCGGCRGGSSGSRAQWPCHSYHLAVKVEELQQRQRRTG